MSHIKWHPRSLSCPTSPWIPTSLTSLLSTLPHCSLTQVYLLSLLFLEHASKILLQGLCTCSFLCLENSTPRDPWLAPLTHLGLCSNTAFSERTCQTILCRILLSISFTLPYFIYLHSTCCWHYAIYLLIVCSPPEISSMKKGIISVIFTAMTWLPTIVPST